MILTIDSKIFIKKDKINDLIKKIRYSIPLDKTNNTDNIYLILEFCGWYAHLDIEGNIVSLKIKNPKTENTNNILYTLASFIEKDGYITLFDNNKQECYTFLFNGKSLKYQKFTKEFINYKSEKELTKYYKKIVKEIFNNTNLTKEELKITIDKLFIYSILEL